MKRRYTAAEVPTFVASGVLPAYVENIVSRDDVAVGALWPKGPPARPTEGATACHRAGAKRFDYKLQIPNNAGSRYM